jgi:prepilin-type N-terminal cleavage/methylation domain-containing protein
MYCVKRHLYFNCHSGLDPESSIFELDSRFPGNDRFQICLKKPWTRCTESHNLEVKRSKQKMNDSIRFDERLECGIRNSEFGISIPQSAIRNPQSKGMTMIEVIVVMMIIGILAAVVVPKLGLPTATSTASVDGAAYMVASDIRYAQEFAMANRVSKTVTFTSGSSTYTFGPTNTLDPSGRLPSGITTRDNYTITFNSLGEPITGGDESVRVWDGVRTRTISVVNYTGKVNIS